MLVKSDVLKRKRKSIGESYIYYNYEKDIKQLRHRILLVEFYAHLRDICNVLEFEVEPPLSPTSTMLRQVPTSDAMAIIEKDNRKRKIFIEVHISTNKFNYFKYEQLKENFALIVITDVKNIKHDRLKIITINTDFDNILEVLKWESVHAY